MRKCAKNARVREKTCGKNGNVREKWKCARKRARELLPHKKTAATSKTHLPHKTVTFAARGNIKETGGNIKVTGGKTKGKKAINQMCP